MKMKMVCELSWTGADTILDGDKSPVNEAENCRFSSFSMKIISLLLLSQTENKKKVKKWNSD